MTIYNDLEIKHFNIWKASFPKSKKKKNQLFQNKQQTSKFFLEMFVLFFAIFSFHPVFLPFFCIFIHFYDSLFSVSCC